MVTVTAAAAERLREELQAATEEPEVGVRIIPSSSVPNQLEMVLDIEKEGDQVVDSEGVKILLLGSDIAQALEGMVIDYQETTQGGRFTISKLASDT